MLLKAAFRWISAPTVPSMISSSAALPGIPTPTPAGTRPASRSAPIKWADLSEPGYGAALLNDGRYGYDVHDGVLRLSLLRAATYPDPRRPGAHDFTYALLPHLGDWRQGGVIPAGYDLNAPALPLAVAAQPAGALPAAYSQFRVDAPNVVLETVKKPRMAPA